MLQAATGFIYYVSVAGVTGGRQAIPSQVVSKIRLVKALTDKPVCVGFGVSTPEQARVLSRIADGPAASPVIFTGDFNCVDTDTPHAAIKAAGLVDVWRALHADATVAESGSFHQFTGAHNLARIDFIYASPALQPQAAEIIHTSSNGNYPSDHFPVRATLTY